MCNLVILINIYIAPESMVFTVLQLFKKQQKQPFANVLQIDVLWN